ncbi:MAG: sulfatase [Phycisphaeraceae bacterium]
MNSPNILFLFSDQHNARCMSCAGHPEVRTPHLDRLAREGTRFANAYANNPICTPSRVSFLSSLYPSTHGYYGLYGPEPAAPMTSLFRWFAEHGYRTGALGKLHTPRYWIERDCQFVYDEFVEHPKYLDAVGLYESNDNRAFCGNRDGEPSQLPLEHSCEMVLAQQFRRFVRNEGEPKDRGDDAAPWLAWVSFARPHQPWTASEPFASMYPPESMTLPPGVDDDARAHRDQRPDEPRLRRLLSQYLGLVSQVDHAIGQILAELEARGELENTIIVYTSDHGDYAGEHGRMEKRGGISHGAICRIPMIVRYPAAVRGDAVCDAPVEAVDLFPTLCELAGLASPNHAQGMSFAGPLRGDDQPRRDHALTENPYRKALATERWRYVANLDDQRDELYDQREDPWERRNLIDSPEHQDIRAQLARTLLDRVARARRPVTTINGGWHRHAYDRDGRIDLGRCGPVNAYW